MADIVTLLPAGTGSGATGATFDTGDLHDVATLQVVVAGTPTASSVQLQGSLDGQNWQNVGAPLTSAGAAGAAGPLTGTTATLLTAIMSGEGTYRYFRATTGTISGSGASVTAVLAFGKS